MDQGAGRNEFTVGELSRRTGLTPRSIRELEGLGLIYSAGRSEANYRLYDESALWCANAVQGLRSLGLTLEEIRQLSAVHLGRPEEPLGPHLRTLLDRAEQRIEQRLDDLHATRARIEEFRRDNRAVLAGECEPELVLTDPRRP